MSITLVGRRPASRPASTTSSRPTPPYYAHTHALAFTPPSQPEQKKKKKTKSSTPPPRRRLRNLPPRLRDPKSSSSSSNAALLRPRPREPPARRN
ncbi:hypothetical protein EJ03DRAFT_176602 [Teratosphaeria nubilosa]|uniref:Uncharacterized protein n=1 Tax=Teratosphaeria nubilosa TaxID=161662 RepID=A0A6G1L1P5_9PEZI|nr:hypothetical protein EJ03DRAFT_176602 [Teratosphaeria nubilosa]